MGLSIFFHMSAPAQQWCMTWSIVPTDLQAIMQELVFGTSSLLNDSHFAMLLRSSGQGCGGDGGGVTCAGFSGSTHQVGTGCLMWQLSRQLLGGFTRRADNMRSSLQLCLGQLLASAREG